MFDNLPFVPNSTTLVITGILIFVIILTTYKSFNVTSFVTILVLIAIPSIIAVAVKALKRKAGLKKR